jgi:hypothetical protein
MKPTTSNGVKPTQLKRARNSVPLAAESSREAKRLAAAIMEVLAGARTPQQAADALQISLPRYYQVETRALKALLGACEAQPKGRQANPAKEVADLQRENERLRREVSRQQSLARLAQRTIGLSPPAPPPAKVKGKKSRQRKPATRALTLAARLQQEAATEAPSDNGLSPVAAGAPQSTA